MRETARLVAADGRDLWLAAACIRAHAKPRPPLRRDARAKPLGLGFLQYKKEPLSDAEAVEMAQASWLDYVYGRVMKTAVDRDFMRSDLYDRDNGAGTAQACVDAVLDRMTSP